MYFIRCKNREERKRVRGVFDVTMIEGVDSTVGRRHEICIVL